LQKTIIKKYWLDIKWLLVSLGGPAGSRDSSRDRRKFGRIYQRFWLPRCCDPRHFAIRTVGPPVMLFAMPDWNSLPSE
jgi:hypothetical protein